VSFDITVDDLPDLVRGAALLGTGGGGDPQIGRTLVAHALGKTGRIKILDPDDLSDDDFVIPTAMMGAPSVLLERLPKGTEPVQALRALEETLGRKATATMPIESGGINSMIPLFVGAQTGLPVVDADGMGRAFPELQMETFAIYGINASPLAIANERGHTAVMDTGADNKRMEDFARAITVRMGGVAYIAEYAMSGAEVRRTAIPRTLSLALMLGRTLRDAREEHCDPVEALVEALKSTLYQHGEIVFTGKIIDVDRRTVDGFTRGTARLEAFDGDTRCELNFQNEFLLARVDGETVTIVPDLIAVLHLETGEPITSETLRYGQRVHVLAISTPAMMRTPEALKVFGPVAFGFDEEFVPVEDLAAARQASDLSSDLIEKAAQR
jgi:DUF917 family protein